MLVDSHCHLDFPDFGDEVDDVVARARRAGVGCMVTICTGLSRFDRTLALVERYPDVYAAAGIHPHDAEKEGDVTVERLCEVARHPKIVGIGETGLDYFYDNSPRDRQQASFRTHIRAARQAGLPLVVHTREADEDTIGILKEEGAGERPLRGVLHCFSGGRRLAEEAIGFGFYLSLSGILTFKAAEELRAIIRDMPLDRLLVETDAPYLAPVPKRGKRNEPAFVIHTAAKLAEVKGLSPAALAERTTANFLALFNKAAAPIAARE
jgi:TatD DNase family protein